MIDECTNFWTAFQSKHCNLRSWNLSSTSAVTAAAVAAAHTPLLKQPPSGEVYLRCYRQATVYKMLQFSRIFFKNFQTESLPFKKDREITSRFNSENILAKCDMVVAAMVVSPSICYMYALRHSAIILLKNVYVRLFQFHLIFMSCT